MPAAKKESLPLVRDPDDMVTFEEFDKLNEFAKKMTERRDELFDLLDWVGRAIVTRNANGRKSDKFCRLCQVSRLHKEPCRHADIWRLAGGNS